MQMDFAFRSGVQFSTTSTLYSSWCHLAALVSNNVSDMMRILPKGGLTSLGPKL